MKKLNYLFVISILFISCNYSNNNDSGLIATIGQQPSIASNTKGEVIIVFGDEESIYYSSSKNQGDSFSEPSLVAKHEGLVLGYSSGPGIAITSKSIVVTAPDKMGNLNAWSRPVDIESWSGPFRINDVDKSVGESLSDITSTPDGHLYCVWIDTRIMEQDSHEEHSDAEHKKPMIESGPKVEVDLSQMTPIGITMGELIDIIGDIPENAILNFHDDNDGKLYWVLYDKDKNVLKAENLEEYTKFRERNKDRIKTEGKIYLASSFDGGKTWTKSKMVYSSPDGSVCECCKPSIISNNDGNLTVMFRNNIDGSRDLHFTKSDDGGETFSTPEKLGSGTWKINGCPMDGGDLTLDKKSKLMTVWKRKGDIFMSNSSAWEEKIGSGRSPSISSNNQNTYIGFSQGEDIISTTINDLVANKIGTGSSPKVLALENGAIYFWVNSDGINYKKVL
jgi:hypothetical protein